jgi:hypothetical protein
MSGSIETINLPLTIAMRGRPIPTTEQSTVAQVDPEHRVTQEHQAGQEQQVSQEHQVEQEQQVSEKPQVHKRLVDDDETRDIAGIPADELIPQPPLLAKDGSVSSFSSLKPCPVLSLCFALSPVLPSSPP